MAAVHPRHGKQRGNDGEETLSAEKANKLLRCASFGLTKSANMIAKVARAKIYAKVVKKHLSTRTMPGEEKKDLPGPADYDVTDARDIANAKGGVEFGGKNITRELTAVDPTYSAQLKTPGPGEYNIDQSERKNDWGGVAGLRRVPSMKFAMSDRMREQRVLYLGKGTEIMAKDTPGPGTYSGTNFSSFRGVNPYGPPHTFGATNHMQTYETASPGPLRYNVVKPSAYSPQFGFGASQRGEGNKVFAGEDFMQQGRMTPGPVLPQMSTFGEKKGGPSFTFGGHITKRKYPKRYDKPPRKESGAAGKGSRGGGGSRAAANARDAAAGKKRKKKKKKGKPPMDRAARARAAALRRQKRAADKDYSWLYEGEKPTKGTYKKSLDGNDLGSALYRSSSSCNFGTGNRFNPFVFMAHSPSVGKLYTDSPGPCYAPKGDMGTGPSARFPAGPKHQLTPEERTRLKYPGPGQYNLLLEHRLEERELIKHLEEQGYTVDEDGNVVLLGGGAIPDDDEVTVVDSDEEVTVLHTTDAARQAAAQAAAQQQAASARQPGDSVAEEGEGAGADGSVLNVTHVDGTSPGAQRNSPTPASSKVVKNLQRSPIKTHTQPASASPPTSSPSRRRIRSPGAPSVSRMKKSLRETHSRRTNQASGGGGKTEDGQDVEADVGAGGGSSAKAGRSMGVVSQRPTGLVAGRSTAPSVKPLSRAKTRAQLSAARPASTRRMVKGRSRLTPAPASGPPVPINQLNTQIKSAKHLEQVRRKFPDTGAPKGIKFAKGPGMRSAGSYRFSQSSRQVEYWKLYRGAENAPKAIDSPGPGSYELASSSFRPANPHGPPHTFGATNHEIKYDTISPGPLAYNAVPRPKYSPKFGFGASSRGADKKTYGGGEQFMNKGTLGPGMFLVHSNLDELIKGGVISGSRRELGRIHPEKAALPGPGTYAVENVNLKKGPSTQFA